MTDPRAATPAAGPYRRFAAAYAAGAERRFSEAMARFALKRARRGPGNCASVLDIACGVGAACEYFAGRGLRAAGADASPDMLRHARAAARDRGLDISYLEADLREAAVPEPVDLVTCMYDSLNFMLTDDDLRRAFRAARGALRPGGSYVFDMYTVRGLAEVWGATDEVHTVHPDHFVATRTRPDPASMTCTKTLWGFDRQGAVWHRWEERHTARAHRLDAIRAALAAAGLTVRELLGWDGAAPVPLTDATTRLVVVAGAR